MNLGTRLNILIGKTAAEAARNYTKKNITVDNSIFNVLNKDQSQQLMDSLETLGNYAKAKKVKIRFSNAEELIPELHSNREVEATKNSIHVQVTNKNKRTDGIIMSAKTNYKKPFMREIYENVQRLCDDRSPIVKHRNITLFNLSYKGIIPSSKLNKYVIHNN